MLAKSTQRAIALVRALPPQLPLPCKLRRTNSCTRLIIHCHAHQYCSGTARQLQPDQLFPSCPVGFLHMPRTLTALLLPSSQSRSASTASAPESMQMKKDLQDMLQLATSAAARAKSSLETIDQQDDWAGLRAELDRLREEMKSETLWQDDAGRAAEVQRAAARLEERINAYDVLKAELEEGLVMIDMAREESDLDLAREVTRDMTGVAERLEQESFKMMMSEPTDKNGCFIELRAGAGGLEACDWTATLARMYERWAADHSHDVGIVDEGKGDVGYKHITLEISGEHAYGWCKYETGVHRFVRLSKFGEAKRQTAFVSVHVYPQLDEEIISENEIAISKHDIRIDVMRAQGAGGQHVNKTESAVRIVHIPTGITVTCQKTRSQIKNRETAMQMLRSRLYQQQLASQAAQKAESYASLPEHSWGSQIRSYVMMPYQLVKDLRSGYERTDVQNVLDGELDKIMEANLLHFKRQKA